MTDVLVSGIPGKREGTTTSSAAAIVIKLRASMLPSTYVMEYGDAEFRVELVGVTYLEALLFGSNTLKVV